MSLTTMYPAKNNSPRTVLVAAIGAADTELILDDASVLPAAPNLLVLGIGDDAEIVKYNAISGNVVSGLVRGVNGTIAGAWPINTTAARNITAVDHEAFRENIIDLQNQVNTKANSSIVASDFSASVSYAIGDYCVYEGVLYRFTSAHSAEEWNSAHVTSITIAAELKGIDTSLSNKAPLESPALSGTPTAPTQAINNNSNRLATTAFVQAHAPIHLTLTASAGTTATKTDSRITSTMEVIKCVYGNPVNVGSDINWTTSTGSIIFTGTFTGATTITVVLIETN